MKQLLERIRAEVVRAGKDFATMATNLVKTFSKSLKWIGIAMLWTLAVAICLAIVGTFFVTLIYLIWTKVVPATWDATTWIVDILFSFPVEFAILIGTYFTLFFFVETSTRYAHDRMLGIMPPLSFREECAKTFQESYTNHVRWWAWAPAMLVITLGIAWAHPGPALLAGFFDQTSAWGSSFISSWHVHHILHGNDPMVSAQVREAMAQPSWFWWHASWWLFVITVIDTLVVFFENLWRAISAGWAIVTQHVDQWYKDHQAQRLIALTTRVEQPVSAPTTTTTVTPSTPAGAGGTPSVNVSTTVASPEKPAGIGRGIALGSLGAILIGAIPEILAGMGHVWLDVNHERRERKGYA